MLCFFVIIISGTLPGGHIWISLIHFSHKLTWFYCNIKCTHQFNFSLLMIQKFNLFFRTQSTVPTYIRIWLYCCSSQYNSLYCWVHWRLRDELYFLSVHWSDAYHCDCYVLLLMNIQCCPFTYCYISESKIYVFKQCILNTLYTE